MYISVAPLLGESWLTQSSMYHVWTTYSFLNSSNFGFAFPVFCNFVIIDRVSMLFAKGGRHGL